VKVLCHVLAATLSLPAWAQDKVEKKKPAAKKPAAAKKQDSAQHRAHMQATPEQIRKFNELQKKQQQQKAQP
jgi:hypothetical protein